MTSMPLRCAQISGCSTAAARKVSAAQSTTLRFSWRRRLASFPMLVVLPAPFTPTMKITRVPLPFCEVAMPLAATSGRTGAFRMRIMCGVISRLSCVASARAWRSIFSRTASKISRVGFTPKSAESSAVSRSFRIEGSIFRSPRKTLSTASARTAFVLLTEALRRSARLGSGLPKREIIRLHWAAQVQSEIVAEAPFEGPGGIRDSSGLLRRLFREKVALFYSRQANLVQNRDGIAILCACVGVQVNSLLCTISHSPADFFWQVLEHNLIVAEVNVTVARYTDLHSVFSQSTGH